MLKHFALWLFFGSAACVAAILFVPQGRLACSEPYLHETSPDGRWTLTLCSRPLLFAMPGGGGDAPGWIVLRDVDGAIRGVSDLSMLQMYGGAAPGTPLIWGPRRVVKPMVLELPIRSASSPFRQWLDDRIWRWRALLGLTPTDDDLH
ncbi:hypothetical protein [Tianweitania sp.]|uniref:hypothetical protein n=1 Tax=Tianweitania sp. TaxID=2021634 RepID=UPI00289C1069|nr:hypothetical protein [Tianweitania sp.]